MKSLLSSLLIACLASTCIGQSWTDANATYDAAFGTGNYKRHECGAIGCSVAGLQKAMVVGGRGSGDKRRPIIYDFATNHISLGAQCPKEIHHFQAVLYQDSIVVLGMAMTGGYPNEVPVDKVYFYLVNSDTWVEYDTVPVARRRGSTQAVVHGDWIYFFNGLTQGHKGGWSNKVDRYNPLTKTWEIMSDSPRTRDHGVAIKNGNLVYIVGGRNSFAGQTDANGLGGVHYNPKLAIDVYNLTTDSWTTLPASADLPVLRGGLMGVLQTNSLNHDQLSVWGGEYGGGTHDTGIGLDLATLSWSPLPDLPTTLHGDQMIQFSSDSLFVMAGSISGGNEKDISSANYMSSLITATTFPIEAIWEQLEVVRTTGRQVAVRWAVTENELATKYVVEFQEDGLGWQACSEVPALGTSGFHQYQAAFDRVWSSGKIFVRVHGYGLDGSELWSPTVELTDLDLPAGLAFPNPLPAGQRTLSFSTVVNHAQLTGLDGRVVAETHDQDTWELPETLAAGLYHLSVTVGSDKRHQQLVLR